jgi:hypothetical protein
MHNLGSKLEMTLEYKIEKNIPIAGFGMNGEPPYPFAKMEIGDSVLIQPRRGESVSQCSNRVRAASQRGWDRKFCTRTVEDAVRIWRIK